jgi:hypothetical protein
MGGVLLRETGVNKDGLAEKGEVDAYDFPGGYVPEKLVQVHAKIAVHGWCHLADYLCLGITNSSSFGREDELEVCLTSRPGLSKDDAKADPNSIGIPPNNCGSHQRTLTVRYNMLQNRPSDQCGESPGQADHLSGGFVDQPDQAGLLCQELLNFLVKSWENIFPLTHHSYLRALENRSIGVLVNASDVLGEGYP